jgi:hypothetical protein
MNVEREKMAKIRIELEIDLGVENPKKDDDYEKSWWENNVFNAENLSIHSDEIGDYVGKIVSVQKLRWIDENTKINA